jgi:large subunit ribosomal protein L28
MSRRCVICHKKTLYGNSITRRGMAKAKGGVGQKITGTTKRKFFPNLQKRRIIIEGKLTRAFVCVKCIKGGKAIFPTKKTV